MCCATVGTTTTPGRRRNRLQNTLVVAETALGFTLLIGSGLLIRSMLNLLHLDPGFDFKQTVHFDIPGIPIQAKSLSSGNSSQNWLPSPELRAFLPAISFPEGAVLGLSSRFPATSTRPSMCPHVS
jgi:hypothetical protein